LRNKSDEEYSSLLFLVQFKMNLLCGFFKVFSSNKQVHGGMFCLIINLKKIPVSSTLVLKFITGNYAFIILVFDFFI